MITDRWVEEGCKDRVRRRFFRVKGSDRNSHRICYDEKVGERYYAA